MVSVLVLMIHEMVQILKRARLQVSPVLGKSKLYW